MPDGPGKTVVETACLGCHEPVRISNAGYNRQDWQNVVHMMLNVGAPVPPDQVGVLTEYLVKNFPEKPEPAPSIIAGNAEVAIKEWVVPTAGARPHDPLAYADGSIWFTGNFAGYIGKLDPKTGKFTEYSLPDPKARDPHTPKSNPCGMVITSQDIPWFCEFGSNRLASIDPETMAIHEHVLPNAASRPRRTPSRPMTSSGTPTMHAAISAGSIRRRARCRSFLLRAGQTRCRTAACT